MSEQQDVRFEVTYSPPECKGQTVYHTVHIVGGNHELGEWQKSRALQLEQTGLNQWMLTTQMPKISLSEPGRTSRTSMYRYFVVEREGMPVQGESLPMDENQIKVIAESPSIDLVLPVRADPTQDTPVRLSYTMRTNTYDMNDDKYFNPLLPVATKMYSFRTRNKKKSDHGLDEEQQRRMLGDFTGLRPEQQFALLLGLLQNYFDHLKGTDKRELRDQFQTLQKKQIEAEHEARKSSLVHSPTEQKDDPFSLVRADSAKRDEKEWQEFKRWKDQCSSTAAPMAGMAADQGCWEAEKQQLLAQVAVLEKRVTKANGKNGQAQQEMEGERRREKEQRDEMKLKFEELQRELGEVSMMYEEAKKQSAKSVVEAGAKEREAREKVEVELKRKEQEWESQKRAAEAGLLPIFQAMHPPIGQEKEKEGAALFTEELQQVVADIVGEQLPPAILQAAEGATVLKQRCLVEGRRRKQLQEQVHELKGGIRVLCRIRPLGAAGGESDGDGGVVNPQTDSDLIVSNLDGGKGKAEMGFKYDRVFAPGSAQADVYAEISPLVHSVVDGYNACVMAYGQTGSGKTHTMLGPDNNGDRVGDTLGPQAGVMIRAVSELVDLAEANRVRMEFEVQVGVVEVYNEKIRDLLAKKTKGGQPECEVKRRKEGGVEIRGMEYTAVDEADEVMALLKAAMGNRAVKATAMNAASSRSHLLLFVKLNTTHLKTGKGTTATLCMVDLAGSERVARSGVKQGSEGFSEAVGINKSLGALGDVMHSLQSGSGHVPYRNSVLTHALSDMLGGKAKVAMLCQITPAAASREETVSTLEFGSRVGKVALGAARKNIVAGSMGKGAKEAASKAIKGMENKVKSLEEKVGALHNQLEGAEGKAQNAEHKAKEAESRAREAEIRVKEMEKQQQQLEKQLHSQQSRAQPIRRQTSTASSAGSNSNPAADEERKRAAARVKARREKEALLQQKQRTQQERERATAAADVTPAGRAKARREALMKEKEEKQQQRLQQKADRRATAGSSGRKLTASGKTPSGRRMSRPSPAKKTAVGKRRTSTGVSPTGTQP